VVFGKNKENSYCPLGSFIMTTLDITVHNSDTRASDPATMDCYCHFPVHTVHVQTYTTSARNDRPVLLHSCHSLMFTVFVQLTQSYLRRHLYEDPAFMVHRKGI